MLACSLAWLALAWLVVACLLACSLACLVGWLLACLLARSLGRSVGRSVGWLLLVCLICCVVLVLCCHVCCAVQVGRSLGHAARRGRRGVRASVVFSYSPILIVARNGTNPWATQGPPSKKSPIPPDLQKCNVPSQTSGEKESCRELLANHQPPPKKKATKRKHN